MAENEIKILAIESSCDETAAAVSVGGNIVSDTVASQIDIHKVYGGVVPEIASRNHLLKVTEVTDTVMKKSGLTFGELDAVAVTCGPGLVGALLVGVSYAKALAYASGVKLIGVNHMMGHISACYLAGAKPPFICLVVSGGHTMVVLVKDYTDFEVLGQTRDDAAGEAFDKVARVMGLGYPGGPLLDRLADAGDSGAFAFPRVMLKEDNYDFSFSGLKSAVLNRINTAQMKGETINKEDLCASFRACICEILTQKTVRAAVEYGIETVSVCGGVACNSLLRRELADECAAKGLKLVVPAVEYCSDNAAMIVKAAHCLYLKGDFADLTLNADPSLSL